MIHPEQERVRKLLTEAVTLLCRNSLQFEEEVMVEGLLGITLDKRDVLLVSIRETVQQTLREVTSSGRSEKETAPPPSPGKRRRRKRSQDSDSDGPPSIPSKKPTPDPAASDDQDSRPDPEQRLKVNVKKELPEDHYDSDHDQDSSSQTFSKVDGRTFHPAHDSTSHSEGHTRLKQEPPSEDGGGGMRIKQETEEGEECFVIDSDGEDMSDSSHSNSMSLSMLENQLQMASQNWQAMDGSGGFDLSNLAQQGQNWSGQFDASGQQLQGGNQGNVPFMGSPQPGTSQDGQRKLAMDGGILQCRSCFKWFTNPRLIRQHMNVIHHGCYLPYCVTCHQPCITQKQQQQHLQQHGIAQHRCFVCMEEFTDKSELKVHRGKCGVLQYEFQCGWCAKTIKGLSNLMFHVKSVHERHFYYVCECGKQFFWVQSYRRHVMNCNAEPVLNPHKVVTAHETKD